MSEPETAHALRIRHRRAWGTAGIGVLLLAVAFPIGLIGNGDQAIAPFAFGALMVAGGLVALVHVARMRFLLARNPWTVRPCRFAAVGGGNGQPTLVLWPPDPPSDSEQVGPAAVEPRGPFEAVVSPVSVIWRWGALEACDGATVWFVGSRRWGGVVAVPGTMELFWVRPLRIPPLRWFLARRVLDAGGPRDRR
ncbi:hypothetical protein [Frankia gtarii]|uniref:hypothetical protein n=1 Tax=Frankia gtarii TaxID=2950102 RepID=UPI0021C1442F|nr:hypothetical protein [Frankia gtarii]